MKDFVIKSDTIGLVRVVGSQPADIVQAIIKKILDTFGYEANWKVNITINSAATIVAAHQIHYFPKVGLNINLIRTCVHHTILVIDKIMAIINKLNGAIKKVPKFVKFLVE